MPSEPFSRLNSFPNARYHAAYNLVTWHPLGVLDDRVLDQIANFLEHHEHVATAASFHRYTDLSGLTDIQLRYGHVFDVAQRRKASVAGLPRVKSAIFSDTVVGFGMARMYETLMSGASVQVRAFRDRQEVADWLTVPAEALLES
jgi:hypothetical protein